MTPDLTRIRFLLMDVDGVLTDGRVHFDPNTLAETKSLHMHDAAGLVYWNRTGGLSGFVSGRKSRVVEERAKELGIHEIHLGHLHKVPIYESILERHGLDADQVAYIGDDILDLPIMKLVGFTAAPLDARPDVRDFVDHVTEVRGGFGAVREVIELLMKAQGTWQRILAGEALRPAEERPS